MCYWLLDANILMISQHEETIVLGQSNHMLALAQEQFIQIKRSIKMFYL